MVLSLFRGLLDPTWVFPKNRGTPKSSIFSRDFHCKPSILGYHYFWKHPNNRDSQKLFTVYRLSFGPGVA